MSSQLQAPIRKAIFPVGGLGSRFFPATKAMPKEMLTVFDRPLVQYAVEEAKSAVIQQMIFVTGRGKSAIEDHFDEAPELARLFQRKNDHKALERYRDLVFMPGDLVYVRQPEPLGLGHAVLCAQSLISSHEPFAVLLADDLIDASPTCLEQMVALHSSVGGNIIALMEVEDDEVSNYGIVEVAQDHGPYVSIGNIVEKPARQDAPSRWAVVGRYILNPLIFACLEHQKEGIGGEIQLTDGISKLIHVGQPVYGLKFQGKRFDCGNFQGFFAANVAYALRHKECHHMAKMLLQKMDSELDK